MTRPAFVVAAVVGALTCFVDARVARADGAFPASQSVLLPRDRPKTIAVASTFGLLVSEDDGATWQYACERSESTTARQYILGAPPDYRVYAIADTGIAMTPDLGCSWTVGSGDIGPIDPISPPLVDDVFPHPTDAKRAYIIGSRTKPEMQQQAIFVSHDGGMTYTGPLFQAPGGNTLTGIEVPVTAPETAYGTYYSEELSLNLVHPGLIRSNDGGAHWTTTNLEPQLGQVRPFLAAVDPVDAEKIYLRVIGKNTTGAWTESLAISTDGGKTWSKPVTIDPGQLTGFLRRADGTLLLIAVKMDKFIGFKSTDGGKSFVDWPLTIHPRGISERDGILYATTDELLDAASLMSSKDGVTWTPRLQFAGYQIVGPRECVRAICHDDCLNYIMKVPFACNACTLQGGAPPPGACPTGGAGAGGTGGTTPPRKGSSCDLGGASPTFAGVGSALVLAGLLALGRSRRRKKCAQRR